MMLYDEVTDTLVTACFDGHGENGDLVARYLRDKISENLICHPLFSTDLRRAILETIRNAEKTMIQRFYKECAFSGTTLCLCTIRDNRLVTANIGDSRIVLCGNDTATAITIDHKADLPVERQRIENSGGRVVSKDYGGGNSGPARVYLKYADIPGLAMSRSLGDCVPHEAGVSSEPEFFERDIDPTDQFIIVATDGIWDFTSPQEAADLILLHSSPESALSGLLRESYSKWITKVGGGVMDDTSAIVIYLNNWRRGAHGNSTCRGN